MKKSILKKVLLYLSSSPDNVPPPYLSRDVYGIICEAFGVEDPYKEIKRVSNKRALQLLPKLRKRLENAEDPLFEAVRIAIIGNIIDFGVSNNFRLEDVEAFEEVPIGINHFEELKRDVEKAKTILYIADNAGEVVFDRVFVEFLHRMGKRIYFAVRSKPIINDATKEDAIEVGIDRFAVIVDSGSDAPGIAFDRVTDTFKHLFADADVVISKGQGNFETLDDVPRSVYLLLRAKCSVVASILNTSIGDIVILKGGKECGAGLLL